MASKEQLVNRASASRSAKIILLALSSLFALGLCEVALRARMSEESIVRRSGGESWWQYIWLKGRQEALAKGQLTPVNPMMQYSSSLGWKPRPNSHLEQLNTNSRGVRGAREYPYEKKHEETRIVVVGDSFTYAGRYGPDKPPIADHEVYTALLEQALPGVSVINLGVPGYGTDQQFLYLREEGYKYGPDLVIVTLYVDDWHRSTLSFRDFAKPKFELRNQELVLTGLPIPDPEEIDRTIRPQTPLCYLCVVTGSVLRRYAWHWAPPGRLFVDRLNEAILDRLREEITQREAKLLVVVIPSYTLEEIWDRSERSLDEWGRRTGVPVLLLRHTFSSLPAEDQRKLFVDHLTPFGHRVTAEAIQKVISERQLLPDALGKEPHDE